MKLKHHKSLGSTTFLYMKIEYNKALWIVAVLAIVLTMPALGLADFYSKGEPREAIVAYTMLEHGNWILPINNGGDIPYKPPFFHWCIALCSLLQGYVSEYTSRLPSAIALVLMAVGGFRFFARRRGVGLALIATVLTLTAFEVHRAGTNCRVDMVNTAFMVGALYLMYAWWERGKHALPWLAILCMSGAALTKGPVGILLPCFVMGVFMLTQRENVWSAFWRMALIALCAMVLPLLWYYAAWQQGGDEFLRLVKEENVDRLLGKMSYESHENPFWYNFITLITGWLPYTLMLLCSLFVLPWKQFSKTRLVQSIRKADSLQVFTWLCFGLILFFYCIPKSKRSVYLLPCYPFMAMLMAQYIVWLMSNKKDVVLKAFVWIMAAIGIILTLAFVVLKWQCVPDSIFHGKHAAANVAMLHALENIALTPRTMFLSWLPGIVGVLAIRHLWPKSGRYLSSRAIDFILSLVVCIFLSLDNVFQPAVLNTKADKALAPEIEERFDMQHLYSYMSAPMLHFFSLNFYLGDRIQQFDKVLPETGVVMLPEDDKETFLSTCGKGYQLQKVWQIPRAVEEKHEVGFYQFKRAEK